MLQDLLQSSREPLDKSPAGGEVYDGLSDTPMYNERIDQSSPRFGICTWISLSKSLPGALTSKVNHFLFLVTSLDRFEGLWSYAPGSCWLARHHRNNPPPSTGENIPHVSLIFLPWRFCCMNPSGYSSQPSRLQNPASQETGDPVSSSSYSVSVRVLSDSFADEWMGGGGGGLVVE